MVLAVFVGLAIAFGAAFWIAIGVLAIGAGYVRFAGSMWWIAGAGAPVLLVENGQLHGRIRPLAKNEPADCTADGWWDFVLPVADLGRVRLDGRQPRARTLVVELPDAVDAQLLSDPQTSWYATRWRDHIGSPAAWPAGRMLARPGRRARVEALLSDLQAVVRSDI